MMTPSEQLEFYLQESESSYASAETRRAAGDWMGVVFNISHAARAGSCER